jgi:hypothetical protein
MSCGGPHLRERNLFLRIHFRDRDYTVIVNEIPVSSSSESPPDAFRADADNIKLILTAPEPSLEDNKAQVLLL